MKRISPCKECKERCVGCHGRCQPYKEWAEGIKKITRKSCEIKEILCYQTAGKSRNLKKKWRQSNGRSGRTYKTPKAP